MRATSCAINCCATTSGSSERRFCGRLSKRSELNGRASFLRHGWAEDSEQAAGRRVARDQRDAYRTNCTCSAGVAVSGRQQERTPRRAQRETRRAFEMGQRFAADVPDDCAGHGQRPDPIVRYIDTNGARV